jgi:translation initiation factor IF-3
VPEVRLVGEDGKQIGVIKTPDALRYAQERDLDLVEVAPDARPPVCRVLDYSKYKYEQAQKHKAARKHQQQITIREIKFRPKIAQHDYDTKKGHVTRFLKGKDKVKITIMFRGREVTHPERGTALLDRLAGELADIAVIEQSPLQDGRNMTMLLAPSKAVLAGEHGKEDGAEAANGAAAPAAESPDGVAAPVAESPDGVAAPAAESPDGAAAPVAESPDGAAAPVAETPDGAAAPVGDNSVGAATPGAQTSDDAAAPAAAGTEPEPAAATPDTGDAAEPAAGGATA